MCCFLLIKKQRPRRVFAPFGEPYRVLSYGDVGHPQHEQHAAEEENEAQKEHRGTATPPALLVALGETSVVSFLDVLVIRKTEIHPYTNVLQNIGIKPCICSHIPIFEKYIHLLLNLV